MTFLRARDFPADERTFIGLLARDCARGIERARLYDQALTAVRVRDDFLSVAGHELRTPLAALVLQAEGLAWMSEGAPLPMVKERAHAVLKSVGRLIHLVDELLDTSRITSGRLPLQRETVELAGLVTEVVARLTTNGRRSSAPVRVQVDGAIEGRWDRARIEQVVTNLLTNALKYGRNAPIDVRVGQDARDALLSVQDHGIGIEPGDQARIFERFERAAAPQYGGLGLGLWITREIVSAHGGEIGVTSTPGEGATCNLGETGRGAFTSVPSPMAASELEPQHLTVRSASSAQVCWLMCARTATISPSPSTGVGCERWWPLPSPSSPALPLPQQCAVRSCRRMQL